MQWFEYLVPGLSLTAAAVQIALLLAAAWTDLSTRLISNRACLGLGLAGVVSGSLGGPLALAKSVAVAAALFLVLLLLHAKHILGGGDIKLLVTLVVGQSFTGAMLVIYVTALAGGVLALAHLALRRLPRPRPAPAGAGLLRRVCTAERWRILRHAPLPYGLAIACGGIWGVLFHTGV